MNTAFASRVPRVRFQWTLLGCMAVCAAVAADWPQYRGPTHDGVSTERLKLQWTGSVTNPVWLVPLTNGITGLSVSQGRVFTEVAGDFDVFDQPHKEFCVALSAATGELLWSTEIDARGTSQSLNPRLYPDGGVGYDDGPRGTPSADGNSVYVLSSYHKLYRLNATNGAIIWQTNLITGFAGGVIPWQSAASPLLDGGLIYVNAGSGIGTLMAFAATNGALVWRSHDVTMTHSTPVLATIHGVRQLIFSTQAGLISLNPQTGSKFWEFPVPYNGISIGASPVVCGDVVFITSNYGYGGVATRILYTNSTFAATAAWSNPAQESHWATSVSYQGAIFGQFIPEGPEAELRCVNAATGATIWGEGGFGRGSTLLAGTNLLVLTERGELVLAEANTNAYVELGRFQAIPNYQPDFNKCWNVPAISDGQVYVRSTAYAARYDLSLPAVPAVPGLKLDLPQLTGSNTLELTVRTATGTDLEASRLTGMEIRASTNVSLPPALWTKLTNALVLTNGFVQVTNVDATAPRRYFIVSEPE